jgi:hypothetical protein
VVLDSFRNEKCLSGVGLLPVGEPPEWRGKCGGMGHHCIN